MLSITNLLVISSLIHVSLSMGYIGGPICFVATSGSLISSLKIRQLTLHKNERHLISCHDRCFDPCQDLQLLTWTHSVKLTCGIGNICGFVASPSYVASSGVALSAPFVTTLFFLRQPPPPNPEDPPLFNKNLVLTTWLTSGAVIFNSWRKSFYEPMHMHPAAFFEVDLEIKIGIFLFWVVMARSLYLVAGDLQKLTRGVFYGIFSAYHWLSVSGTMGYIYGLFYRHSWNYALFGLPILLPSLATGQCFVDAIEIAELHDRMIYIWVFAQAWFQISHGIFNFIFLGQYRMMTSWLAVMDFFGPIFLVLFFACTNIVVDRSQPTSLPKYCQTEADFRLWSMNRLTNAPTTFSGGRVQGDQIEVEICAPTVFTTEDTQPLSPRNHSQLNAFAPPQSFSFADMVVADSSQV